jgi:hypothetical protein
VGLPGLASQQERVGLGDRLKELGANVIMPIRYRPTAMHEAAFGVFVGTTRRLNHAIHTNEFVNDNFSHGYSFSSSLEMEIKIPDLVGCKRLSYIPGKRREILPRKLVGPGRHLR